MPAALLASVAVLVLLAAPAAASDNAQPAEGGFPIALVVLAVVAVAFALIWRAVSKRKQSRR